MATRHSLPAFLDSSQISTKKSNGRLSIDVVVVANKENSDSSNNTTSTSTSSCISSTKRNWSKNKENHEVFDDINTSITSNGSDRLSVEGDRRETMDMAQINDMLDMSGDSGASLLNNFDVEKMITASSVKSVASINTHSTLSTDTLQVSSDGSFSTIYKPESFEEEEAHSPKSLASEHSGKSPHHKKSKVSDSRRFSLNSVKSDLSSNGSRRSSRLNPQLTSDVGNIAASDVDEATDLSVLSITSSYTGGGGGGEIRFQSPESVKIIHEIQNRMSEQASTDISFSKEAIDAPFSTRFSQRSTHSSTKSSTSLKSIESSSTEGGTGDNRRATLAIATDALDNMLSEDSSVDVSGTNVSNEEDLAYTAYTGSSTGSPVSTTSTVNLARKGESSHRKGASKTPNRRETVDLNDMQALMADFQEEHGESRGSRLSLDPSEILAEIGAALEDEADKIAVGTSVGTAGISSDKSDNTSLSVNNKSPSQSIRISLGSVKSTERHNSSGRRQSLRRRSTTLQAPTSVPVDDKNDNDDNDDDNKSVMSVVSVVSVVSYDGANTVDGNELDLSTDSTRHSIMTNNTQLFLDNLAGELESEAAGYHVEDDDDNGSIASFCSLNGLLTGADNAFGGASLIIFLIFRPKHTF